jgi:NADH-quinone oxidoreductase subunit M
MSFPWLTVLWAVPLVGAVVTAFLPRRRGAASAKLVALAFAVVTLLVGVAIALQFHAGDGMQLTETHDWISSFGVHYALGVDGLGLLMILLTVVLTPIVFVASWHEADHDAAPSTFFAWALALESFALAVFAATDVFLFYVVFEATLIPAYFLIGRFGREGRAFAALKFLMYQLGGGLVLLAAVIGLYVVSAQAGHPSYLLTDLQQVPMSTTWERWLFVGFMIAFIVKAPLFPLHTWLADTTEKATPGTSVLLVCVLDKIGTFGMLRFCLGLFPHASQWATPVVVTLALISIVYGAFLAIGQDDILRLIGLTSLSHFGFIALGIFALTSQGGSGAILYMVNHGVATAALFLVAGYLIRRTGTSSIRAITGVERSAPVLAGLLLVAGLATLGLPGLSQFVSEILVLISAFDYHWWVGAVAVTGIVLAAVYVLWMYERTMTGAGIPPGDGHDVEHDVEREAEPGAVRRRIPVVVPDLDRRETLAVVPLVAALVLFGFWPMPLLDAANPTVHTLLQHVGVQDDAPQVPAAEEGAH